MNTSYFSTSNTTERSIQRYKEKSQTEQWVDFEHALAHLKSDDSFELGYLRQQIIGLMGTSQFSDKNKIFRNNCIYFSFESLNNIIKAHPSELSSVIRIEMFIRINLLTPEEEKLLEAYTPKIKLAS